MIFCTIALSFKNNTIRFLNRKELVPSAKYKRYTYYDIFLTKLLPYLYNEFPSSILIIDTKHSYEPFNINANENYQLYGYFQSYKYFINEFNSIYKLLDIENLKTNILLKNINPFDYQYTVSLHFRIGDYIYHTNRYIILPIEYYIQSLNYLKILTNNKKLFILYFCEDDSLNIVLDYIKKLSILFPNYQFERCNPKLEDWEQLLLMSCCRYNIIANSIFSWWGGMFNTNKNKLVLYPSTWYVNTATHWCSTELICNKLDDICPPDWVKIVY